jgi:hypothetical protein
MVENDKKRKSKYKNKNKNKGKQNGGRINLISYDAGGTSLGSSAGFIPFVQNIAGSIVWSINSVIATVNATESTLNLASDMGTAWGPNVPPDLK